MPEETKKISEFNESMLKIQRLDNKWREIATARENGEFDKVRWKLDTIEIELNNDAHKLDREDKKNYVKDLIGLNKEIDTNKNLFRLYKLIKKKEKILREIQQECGMGSRYKDIDEDEM